MTEQITVVMDVIAKMDKAQSGIKSLQRELQSLKLPKNLENGFKDSFSNLETIFAKYKSQLESGFMTKNDVTAFAKTGRVLDNELSRLSKHLTELTGQPIDFKVNSSKIIQAEKDLQNLLNKKNELTKNVLELKVGGKTDSVQSLLKELYSTAGNTGAGKAANAALTELSTGNIDAALKKLRELEAAYGKLRSDSKKNALFGAENTNAATTIQNIIKAVESLGSQFSATEGKIRTAKTTLDSVRGEQLSAVTNKTIELARGFETNRDSINQANVALQDYARSSQSMTQQLGDLKTSTQYFFSLRNMFNLLKRGIREAVETVKELDAAMTETAVVTKFSVGDMWAKLPEYTANANALGATVQDMYEATTLYYQQGLNAQQAMSIASETMKMARIGGLEAAEATDMMTAALRGFNMELNETSAQRINDVYSNLAAKTASNTQELGNAMQRTASIAANAGMSFEGTAAFLAQAIETTREPAENIGTAMKTIIARMQEMKKNPLEITEVDGEEVDYNKIDAALKSVGISLKQVNGDFRDNDAVLLDISKHWNSLSQTQQRYIATTIAGSRQQSRFIAMVGDYERTQELMGYANDSSGASNEQFGKTLDSLEAKINKFQNAWKQFLMGIMNDTWTKRLVGAGTTVLNVVNKIINALSFNGKAGLMKSALSIFTGFTALKFAARGVNSLIGGLGGMLDPQSSFSKGFFGGASGLKQQASAAQAAAIYKPIVDALRTQTQQLITKDANIGKFTTGTSSNQNTLSYKDFIKAQTDFRNLFDQKGGFTIKEATGKLSKMSTTQQGLVLSNAPGLTSRISRGLDNYLGTLKLDKEAYDAGVIAKNNILKGMAEGKIPASEIDKVLNPVKFGKVVGGKLGQNIARQGAASAREYLASQEKAIAAETERRLQVVREGNTDWTPITDKERQRTRNQVRKEMANNYLAGQGIKAGEPTKYEKLQQKISNLGSAVTNTGQAFTSFGVILSNLGLSGVGMAFTTLGTTISSFGMMISSLGPALTAIQAKLAETTTFFEAVKLAAIDAGIASTLAWTGLAAGFAGILIGIKAIGNKIEKTARENAEKVKENYSSAIDEISKKESALADNKDRLNELAKGVDAQGNNLSLTNDQYQEYLQLSRDVADVAPELIQGYNAQGNAIIATGDAIDILIEKQQKLRKDAIETYTSLSAMTDVIKGIEASDTYDEVVLRRFDNKQLLEKQRGGILKSFNDANLKTEDISKLIRNSLGREIDFNVLTTSDMQWISEHYNDIINLVKEKNTALSEEAKAGIEGAFSDFHTGFADFETELAPLQDQLQQFLSLEGLDLIGLDLGQEFSVAFNEGLQNIAIDAVLTGDYDNIKNNALEFARGFQEIAGEGSKYKEVLDEVQQAEEEYFDNIEDINALETYQNSLNNSAQELENFANAQLEAGTITQQFYNILISGANKIRQSASEPVVTLSEAINTLSDELEIAKNAYDNFSEATKDRDYSTAADSMSKIFEEALDEKHSSGYGDNTFWTGSRAILDDKTLNSGIENVRTIMKENQKMFAEGKEGFDAFRTRILNLSSDERQELTDLGVTWDKTTGMFEKIPEQAFSRFAEVLHLNDEAFAALLSKAQQWGSLDFGNMDMMRAALSQDTRALQGKSGSYYMNEQDLTQEIRVAHPDWNDDKVAEQLASWKQEGLISLPSKETLSQDKKARKELVNSLKDLNIQNQSDLVKTLGETGSYTKGDLEAYAKEAFGEDNFDQDTFNDDWKITSEKLTNPLAEGNGILKGIASDVSLIAGKESKKRIEEGNATEKDFANIDKVYKDIFGGEGPDTPYQLFNQGKNAEGKPLSYQEYEDTRKSILDTQKILKENLNNLEKGKIAAEKEYGKGSKEEQDYTNRIKKVKTALGSLDTYLFNGETYLGPQGASNMDSSIVQQLMNTGWQEALYKLPLDTISSIDFQNSMQELYDSSLMNNQEFQNQTPAFKQHIQSLLEQMGISAQEAYEQGLISWNPELLSNVSDGGLREAGQKTAQDNAVNLAEATAETAKQDNNNSTLQGNLRKAAQKTAQDNAVALAKETEQAKNKGFASDVKKELSTFDEKDAAFAGDVAKTFNKNIQDAYIKAYEKAAGKGTTVKDLNITPNVPKPTVTSKQNIAPTIANGAGAVAQVAQGAVQETQAKFTVDTSDGEAKINNLKTLVSDTVSIINEGATFTIRVPGLPKLKQAAKAAQAIGKNAGTQTIGVSTGEVDTSTVDDATSTIKNTSADIQVGANTGTAYNKVDTLIGDIGRKSASVSIIPTLKYTKVSASAGGGTATVSLSLAAQGMNNNISYPSLPTFGSLAKGTKSHYGQVGPRNKGGLTLTGEKGYEIAWIPSENRSMIVGAEGPQMLNLPSDTVVWTHEQSKKIIKQKAIPAGSHGDKNTVTAKWSSTIVNDTPSTPNYKKPKPKPKPKPTTVTKDVKDAAKSVKKVSVFWQNIGLKVEATQHRADLNQKAYEKYLAKLKATLTKTGTEGQGNKFIQNTTQLRKYGKSELKQAQKNLNKLGTNKKINKTISWTKDNKSKKEKIDINKYIKKIGENEYIIDSKKLSKAKTNKGKKIDEKGKKAIRDAAEKEIKERLSKVTSAEDLINKSTDSLDEFKQKLYDTFFAWETELTKIWNITQKISATSGKIERLDSFNSLLEAQLSSGEISPENYLKDSLKLFKQRLQQQDNLIKQRQEAISESKKAVNEAIKKSEVNKNYKQVSSLIKASDNLKEAKSEKKDLEKQLKSAKSKKKKQSIQKKINKQNKIIKNSKKTLKEGGYSTKGLSETEYAGLKEYKKNLKNEKKIKSTAQKYTKITQYKDGTVSIDFDYDALMEDKNKGIITSDLAEGIDKYVKDIIDSNNQLNEAYNNLANDLTSLYEDLEELDKAQVDASMELLNIYEDSEQKKLDKLKSLSNALDKAFKNLIDEVKKKLDERRKQEDNIKTERELSQKQQRLATLRADTAGGHAIEIAQLEKEIAEAQQNYQRTLEDQLLDKLEQQGDEASKQRERQIELQEQLLEATNNAAMIDMWMAELTNENTTEARRNEIKGLMHEAYREANNYNEVTGLKKGEIDKNFETLFGGIIGYKQKREALTSSISDAQTALAELKKALEDNTKALSNTSTPKPKTPSSNSSKGEEKGNGKSKKTTKQKAEEKIRAGQSMISAGINSHNNALISRGEELVHEGYATLKSTKTKKTAKQKAEEKIKTGQSMVSAGINSHNNALISQGNKLVHEGYAKLNSIEAKKQYQNKLAEVEKNKKLSAKEFAEVQKKANAAGLNARTYMADLAKTAGLTWEQVIKAAEANKFNKYRIALSFKTDNFIKAYEKIHGKDSYKKDLATAKKKKLEPYKYVTGGLADYTGPAWLDGTPSKPELVLNSTDTKNFIALKDVLSKAIGSTNAVENTYGNATYEININVDHLNNDYDVDKVVERVKKKIVQDSSYRNVTQVRKFR